MDTLVGVGLLADVEAAEADGGDSFAGLAQLAIDHVRRLGLVTALEDFAVDADWPRPATGGSSDSGGCC